MKCIFSVDVEDWFHILDLASTPSLAEWDALPSRVENNFAVLLDLLAEREVRATCFFLGWVARKHPNLVRLAQRGGHEIASHGYAHRLVYHMTPDQFLADATHAKEVIEDACGCEVIGYRSPGFSVTRKTPWFFEKVAEAGYRYDSSVFPGRRGHGGWAGAAYAPHSIQVSGGALMEFPITVTKLFNVPACLFGGGYLRLAPWTLVHKAAMRVLREGRPVVFYIHPREIDPEQPRLPMGYARRFKSYVNLAGALAKLRHVVSTFSFDTFAEYMAEYGPGVPAAISSPNSVEAPR